ncbi:hypothetical protein SLA2020_448990 [Shorea laevis]
MAVGHSGSVYVFSFLCRLGSLPTPPGVSPHFQLPSCRVLDCSALVTQAALTERSPRRVTGSPRAFTLPRSRAAQSWLTTSC